MSLRYLLIRKTSLRLLAFYCSSVPSMTIGAQSLQDGIYTAIQAERGAEEYVHAAPLVTRLICGAIVIPPV